MKNDRTIDERITDKKGKNDKWKNENCVGSDGLMGEMHHSTFVMKLQYTHVAILSCKTNLYFLWNKNNTLTFKYQNANIHFNLGTFKMFISCPNYFETFHAVDIVPIDDWPGQHSLSYVLAPNNESVVRQRQII